MLLVLRSKQHTMSVHARTRTWNGVKWRNAGEVRRLVPDHWLLPKPLWWCWDSRTSWWRSVRRGCSWSGSKSRLCAATRQYSRETDTPSPVAAGRRRRMSRRRWRAAEERIRKPLSRRSSLWVGSTVYRSAETAKVQPTPAQYNSTILHAVESGSSAQKTATALSRGIDPDGVGGLDPLKICRRVRVCFDP